MTCQACLQPPLDLADVLPRDSGVGSSANEVYKPDGRRIPNGLHTFEDRSFRFKRDEFGLCLYGVLDGFSGGQVRFHRGNVQKPETLANSYRRRKITVF